MPCGNGLLEAGEQCDDGNTIDWDGCTGCEVTEFLVNTYTATSQNAPAVALNDDSIIIVWQGGGNQDGSQVGMFGQRYTIDGSAVGAEFQVNTYTSGWQEVPVVAISSSGSFVVAWSSEEQDSWGPGIYAQRYDPQGQPLGAQP